MTDIREEVRRKYAEAIRSKRSCCGCGESCCGGAEDPITQGNYKGGILEAIPDGVVEQSFGCGSPVEKAGLKPGETVLDLGSGAGLDAFLAAGEVGPEGHVFGLDMTNEMILTAEANRAKWGLSNVEFIKGFIEEIPIEDESVDVVVSNCVINLSPDKDAVFREIFRVLRPGGRISVSDIVFLKPLPKEIRESLSAWAGCVSGAIGEKEYQSKLSRAGFSEVCVEKTRVHSFSRDQIREMFPDISPENVPDAGEAVASAWVSAVKPLA